jgi:hypothetical protein
MVSSESRNRDGRVWMGKNLVIFSDGTGQAGGFRFDEVRGSMRRRHRRWPLTQSNTSKDSLVRGGILHLTCSTFAKSLRVGCGKTMARLTQEIVPRQTCIPISSEYSTQWPLLEIHVVHICIPCICGGTRDARVASHAL